MRLAGLAVSTGTLHRVEHERATVGDNAHVRAALLPRLNDHDGWTVRVQRGCATSHGVSL
jgi:hypothetical protein